MKLVASLIVKNELGRYLPECIGHLREFCDLIVVMDDGSTDRTGEWLDDNTDEMMVVEHLDPEDGFFAGHEGRKRQALLHLTLNQSPDWVLAIDADEFVTDWDRVRAYMEGPRQVGTLEMEEIWRAERDVLYLRTDGGWQPHPVPCLWHAKLSGRRGQPLRISDRALACGREPELVRRMFGRSRPTGASIMHFGWTRESERQERYDRYVTADGGKYHANVHLQSIMWPPADVQLEKRAWPPILAKYKAIILQDANK